MGCIFDLETHCHFLFTGIGKHKSIMALGGSTNAVIHLIAMAKAANVALTLDDFQTISNKTPFLADLKPSGKYLMENLHDMGGIPAVARRIFGWKLPNCYRKNSW
jgi:dihydroxyacid dehydratase/phosphogluconate dehydratase